MKSYKIFGVAKNGHVLALYDIHEININNLGEFIYAGQWVAVNGERKKNIYSILLENYEHIDVFIEDKDKVFIEDIKIIEWNGKELLTYGAR